MFRPCDLFWNKTILNHITGPLSLTFKRIYLFVFREKGQGKRSGPHLRSGVWHPQIKAGHTPKRCLNWDLHNKAMCLGFYVILLASKVLGGFRQFLWFLDLQFACNRHSHQNHSARSPAGLIHDSCGHITLSHFWDVASAYFAFLLCTIVGPKQRRQVNANLMGGGWNLSQTFLKAREKS